MNQHKVFCEYCHKEVDFEIRSVYLEGRIKGKIYPYAGKEAVCVNCGKAIFVPELSDENLNALYDVYRQTNGIISRERLLNIPQQYHIGKRPLSRLLGWGEQTFTRYAKGDVPTKQYSDMLLKIADDPIFYLTFLDAHKDRLRSDLAYEKSRKAVLQLLSSAFESKIDAVIKYLLDRCEDITPLALQKALYYIQGFYYAFNGSFLFEEDCEAWIHGPVYRDIYYHYKDYYFDPLNRRQTFDSSFFNAEEKALYDSVIKNVCCYSGKVLEHFTHNEEPWIITRGDLPMTVSSDRIIEKKLIGNYFTKVKTIYKMTSFDDIRKYTEDMFTN